MGQIEQLLIVRVRVHRRHPAATEPETVVQHLGHRGEAVRRARRVGDDAVHRGVVAVVVDAEHQRQVRALRGRGDDDPLGAGCEVLAGVGPLREQPRGLDDHVHAEVGPGQRAGITLRQHVERAPADLQPVAFHGDRFGKVAEDRIVLQQVGQRVGARDVVDRRELDIAVAERRPQHVAADAAKPVDPDSDAHLRCLQWGDTDLRARQRPHKQIIVVGALAAGQSERRRVGREGGASPTIAF